MRAHCHQVEEIQAELRFLISSASLAASILGSHADVNVRRQSDRIQEALERTVCVCQAALHPIHDPDIPREHSSEDILKLLGKVAAFAKLQNPAREGSVQVSASVRPGVRLSVDGVLLFRVLLDLICNAQRTVFEYGGKTVMIVATPETGHVTFSLSTDSPAMSKEFMEYLYPNCTNGCERNDRRPTGISATFASLGLLGASTRIHGSRTGTWALEIRLPVKSSLDELDDYSPAVFLCNGRSEESGAFKS